MDEVPLNIKVKSYQQAYQKRKKEDTPYWEQE
jgi:hypothetical protein